VSIERNYLPKTPVYVTSNDTGTSCKKELGHALAEVGKPDDNLGHQYQSLNQNINLHM